MSERNPINHHPKVEPPKALLGTQAIKEALLGHKPHHVVFDGYIAKVDSVDRKSATFKFTAIDKAHGNWIGVYLMNNQDFYAHSAPVEGNAEILVAGDFSELIHECYWPFHDLLGLANSQKYDRMANCLLDMPKNLRLDALNCLPTKQGYEVATVFIEKIMENTLSFEEWLCEYQQDLSIEAAELGLDRELDFDSEQWAQKKYDLYLAGVTYEEARGFEEYQQAHKPIPPQALSKAWFDLNIDQQVPEAIRKAAEDFCVEYQIKGTSDPMCVANTIAYVLEIGDGCGKFYTVDWAEADFDYDTENMEKLAERLQFAYRTCIKNTHPEATDRDIQNKIENSFLNGLPVKRQEDQQENQEDSFSLSI